MKISIRKNRHGRTTSMRITAQTDADRKELRKFVTGLAEPIRKQVDELGKGTTSK